jgi:predicted DNA-binding transcriptional regulator
LGKDRLVGAGIVVASIAAAIAYLVLFYLGYGALIVSIVVSAAVLVLLGILGWIGWTMATTPSPEPIGASGEEEKKVKESG